MVLERDKGGGGGVVAGLRLASLRHDRRLQAPLRRCRRRRRPLRGWVAVALTKKWRRRWRRLRRGRLRNWRSGSRPGC
jgi:hypothetical protein